MSTTVNGKKKKCIIITAYIEEPFGGGVPMDEFYIQVKEEAEDAYVICADGGYAFAQRAGIAPDLIVGDFDSYAGELPQGGAEVIRVNPIKDDTDTGLALNLACERGFRDVTIIGGFGGRLSHSISNIQLMAAYAYHTERIRAWDPNRTVTLLTDGKTLRAARRSGRHYISLLCHSEVVTGVNISGVFYPLTNAVLTSEFPLGVSNEITADEAVISIDGGTLIVIEE